MLTALVRKFITFQSMFYNPLDYALFCEPSFSFSFTSLFLGTSETQVFDEQSPSGKDYLAEVKGNCYCYYSKNY